MKFWLEKSEINIQKYIISFTVRFETIKNSLHNKTYIINICNDNLCTEHINSNLLNSVSSTESTISWV